MRLADKITIVTGGTRGLGRAIAEQFHAEGATVICAARNPYDIGEVTTDRLVYHRVDVTEEESVRELMRSTMDRFGRIDVLVANAGVSRDGKIARLSLDDWDATVRTNLTGVFLCTREAAAHMTARGEGRIITVSSCVATKPVPGTAAYSATKAAVEAFTRTAAIELGPKGVTVNCLAPGYINGGMGRRLAAVPELWARYQSRLVLDRLGTPEEVAAAAIFLATPASSYINGHILEVSGGLRWIA
ncbi:SDR family NAD(P)-dependent oxidoreductase [Micromonospora sp. NPDC049645]|uniref:SDR family NAD(P)-dependent oxidoreductase n=1 Tax=Micromonospora sp. NPDC049645 TaxID=3155508 RepID=UPI00343ECD04